MSTADTTSAPIAPARSRLYTVDEARQILRIGRTKLYTLATSGKVPHRRIDGTGIRFSDADLDQIIAAAERPVIA